MSRAAVLFDVDGTLLDTNYLHAVAWWRAFRAQGYTDVTMADCHAAIGIASAEMVEHVLGHPDEQVVQGHSGQYQVFTDDITAFGQAAELMRACRDAGLAAVLATSGARGDLEWMLPAIGVEESDIDGAITSEDVEAAKPHPDMLQRALDEHSLDPERTVVLGDTVWDVEAARQAGLRCVALLCGGIGRQNLLDAGAAAVYDDPADLLTHFDDSPLGSLRS